MKIAGIGCRARASVAAIRDALNRAEAVGGPVDAIATIPERADALRGIGLPVVTVDVAGIETPTRSPRIEALFDTGCVAEAAALAACGAGAELVVLRLFSTCRTATAAIAEARTST